jgi:small subunit ribosomal protein S6
VRPYETMIIFDAELEAPVISGVLERALDVVRSQGGNPGNVERWGKRAFAYEMKKRREGYYVLAEFSADPKASAELDRFLHLADEVLRHKIIRLPDKAPTAASRAATAAHSTAEVAKED